MMCARCDQPIRPGEDSRPVDHLAPTGPGMTVHVHARRCRRAPQQTHPSPRFSK